MSDILLEKNSNHGDVAFSGSEEWLVWSKLYWTLAIAFVSFIYYNYVKFSYWSSRGIKGPTPIPFFGTDIYLMLHHRIDIETKWREKYGRVYGIYNGYKPTLVVTDNELLKHVFIKDFDCFTNRVPTTVSPFQKRFLFWSRDAEWSRKRSIISPTFTSRRMKQMFELMRVCTRKFLNQLDQMTQQDEKRSCKAVISKDIYMSFTLDVISKACFSIEFDTYRDKNSDFAKKAFAFARFPVRRLMLLLLLPLQVRKWLNFDLFSESTFSFFDQASNKVIKDRRAANDYNKMGTQSTKALPNDMVQLMLEAERTKNIQLNQDDLKEAHYNGLTTEDIIGDQQAQYIKSEKLGKSLTDFELSGQMIFFFIAGFETTSSAISFCLYELANNPAVQKTLYDELKEQDGDMMLDSIDYSCILELKYLDAFVSEVLRLYSPVTAIDRQAGCDYKVPGMNITIEKGSHITIPYYVLHHDAEYWPQPEKFDINRFLPENRGNIRSCSYAPFGLGPRHCAGMRFALTEIKLALTQLILNYRFSRASSSDNYPPQYNRHLFFLQLKKSDVLIERRA